MTVLVIGSGGREHALVSALASSPSVEAIYCAPGNAGIASEARLVPLKADDIEGLLGFVKENRIDLTVVGPEQPLVDGIVDRFSQEGLDIFGPTAAAARLEGSKVFSKEFMKRHGIPTAAFGAFGQGEIDAALSFVDSLTPPLVVKADGLAAGKGVLICDSAAEARAHIRSMMDGDAFGDAGASVVLEEFLEGEEASLFVLTDGTRYVILPPAQDHKRVFDDDQGKNTGGMGAYAPAPVMTAGLITEVEKLIVGPTLQGMLKEGAPYKGCLYVGLMMTKEGPKVLEYNCRFGDPETQVVLPLLASDAGELFSSIARGSLTPETLRIRDNSAVCVVMASGGYPDAYEKGKHVTGLDRLAGAADICVYHAGTASSGGSVITSGGRVLGITAIGPPDDLGSTIRTAYEAVGMVTFEGAHYRRDIGARALRRTGRTTERTSGR